MPGRHAGIRVAPTTATRKPRVAQDVGGAIAVDANQIGHHVVGAALAAIDQQRHRAAARSPAAGLRDDDVGRRIVRRADLRRPTPAPGRPASAATARVRRSRRVSAGHRRRARPALSQTLMLRWRRAIAPAHGSCGSDVAGRDLRIRRGGSRRPSAQGRDRRRPRWLRRAVRFVKSGTCTSRARSRRASTRPRTARRWRPARPRQRSTLARAPDARSQCHADLRNVTQVAARRQPDAPRLRSQRACCRTAPKNASRPSRTARSRSAAVDRPAIALRRRSCGVACGDDGNRRCREERGDDGFVLLGLARAGRVDQPCRRARPSAACWSIRRWAAASAADRPRAAASGCRDRAAACQAPSTARRRARSRNAAEGQRLAADPPARCATLSRAARATVSRSKPRCGERAHPRRPASFARRPSMPPCRRLAAGRRAGVEHPRAGVVAGEQRDELRGLVLHDEPACSERHRAAGVPSTTRPSGA